MILANEDERLEFKRTLLSTKEITEYVVALGNEGGGWLIIGVSNSKPRAVVGVPEQSHEELLRIQSAVLDSGGIKIRLHPMRAVLRRRRCHGTCENGNVLGSRLLCEGLPVGRPCASFSYSRRPHFLDRRSRSKRSRADCLFSDSAIRARSW